MKAAQAYWAGRIETFKEEIWQAWPKPLKNGLRTALRTSMCNWRDDGVKFSGDAAMLELVMEVWAVSEQINVIGEEAVTRAQAAIDHLNDTVGKFRSNVKNDLASMKAQSDRVEAEVQRMGRAYHDTASLLTSAQFVQAIENAERMAKALDAISKLQGQRISVALFSGDDVAIG